MNGEHFRNALRRLRREMREDRRANPPAPPICEVCGHSFAYVPLVRAYAGEQPCQACLEAKRAYRDKHMPQRPISVVRIVEAPTREELMRERGE